MALVMIMDIQQTVTVEEKHAIAIECLLLQKADVSRLAMFCVSVEKLVTK